MVLFSTFGWESLKGNAVPHLPLIFEGENSATVPAAVSSKTFGHSGHFLARVGMGRRPKGSKSEDLPFDVSYVAFGRKAE